MTEKFAQAKHDSDQKTESKNIVRWGLKKPNLPKLFPTLSPSPL